MDPIHYEPGQVIEFCRRAKGGFKSGERWEVSRIEGERVFVTRDGVEKVLPLQQWKTFNVYRRDTMPVAVGEHLLLTKNNRGANLRNGELRKVAAIDGIGSRSTTDASWTHPGRYTFAKGTPSRARHRKVMSP
jgi:hypothetical protein